LPVNDAPVAGADQDFTYQNTPLYVYPWMLTSNDYDIDGDTVELVGLHNPSRGTLSTDADGNILFTPDPNYVGWAGFDYTITDGQVFTTTHVTVEVQGAYYLSLASAGTLTSSDGSNLSFADADIVQLTVRADGSYQYSMFFDGSDVGLTSSTEDIDAFIIAPEGIYLSTAGSFSVSTPSGGSFSGAGEDVLLFQPGTLGAVTSGAWSFYFDGSDVGLSGTAENVDALARLSDGRLLISTAGSASVSGGVSATDVDLLAFTPIGLGTATSGSWAPYFRGGRASLSSGGNEDINGLAVRESPTGGLPTLYFSTVGNFSVPGIAGANEDIVAFKPTALGSNTAGTYGPGLTLQGGFFGLGAHDVDGFSLGPAPLQGFVGSRAVRQAPAERLHGKSTAAAPASAASADLSAAGVIQRSATVSSHSSSSSSSPSRDCNEVVTHLKAAAQRVIDRLFAELDCPGSETCDLLDDLWSWLDNLR
jgi:hypothetical protein